MANPIVSLTSAAFVALSVLACDGTGPAGPEDFTASSIPAEENDSPCQATGTWRCAFSERLGAYVSQVCRACDAIQPWDAAAWKVCQPDASGSRWINFNLNPMDCAGCGDTFSINCVAGGSSCSPATCPGGCCVGGMCYPGNSNDACGSQGYACKACTAGNQCIAGACVPVCNAATCAGCCILGVCHPGTSAAICGSGGVQCVDCAASGGVCIDSALASKQAGANGVGGTCAR